MILEHTNLKKKCGSHNKLHMELKQRIHARHYIIYILKRDSLINWYKEHNSNTLAKNLYLQILLLRITRVIKKFKMSINKLRLLISYIHYSWFFKLESVDVFSNKWLDQKIPFANKWKGVWKNHLLWYFTARWKGASMFRHIVEIK